MIDGRRTRAVLWRHSGKGSAVPEHRACRSNSKVLPKTESPNRGTGGFPWSPGFWAPTWRRNASAPPVEPKLRLPVVVTAGPPGEDVMARQIEELFLLTCLGGFIAGVTYAVTLLH
jgi:hypothetical protein